MGNDRGRDLPSCCRISAVYVYNRAVDVPGWWLTEGSLQKTYAEILTHKGPKQREHTGMLC